MAILALNATMRNLRCDRIVEQRVAAKELLVLPRARSTSAGVELAFKGILKFDAAQIAPVRLITTAPWIKLASIANVKILAR